METTMYVSSRYFLVIAFYLFLTYMKPKTDLVLLLICIDNVYWMTLIKKQELVLIDLIIGYSQS
ncbi:hypothetical protein CSV77_16215 [Sporosarcina sp. P16b]|nr:hypothetical protein CSV77_16215 [Sporosarcina sp. P16b]